MIVVVVVVVVIVITSSITSENIRIPKKPGVRYNLLSKQNRLLLKMKLFFAVVVEYSHVRNMIVAVEASSFNLQSLKRRYKK
jgi:hypothetical protein